jgi:hypothetical protein
MDANRTIVSQAAMFMQRQRRAVKLRAIRLPIASW